MKTNRSTLGVVAAGWRAIRNLSTRTTRYPKRIEAIRLPGKQARRFHDVASGAWGMWIRRLNPDQRALFETLRAQWNSVAQCAIGAPHLSGGVPNGTKSWLDRTARGPVAPRVCSVDRGAARPSQAPRDSGLPSLMPRALAAARAVLVRREIISRSCFATAQAFSVVGLFWPRSRKRVISCERREVRWARAAIERGC